MAYKILLNDPRLYLLLTMGLGACSMAFAEKGMEMNRLSLSLSERVDRSVSYNQVSHQELE